jgi:hypothetical protein
MDQKVETKPFRKTYPLAEHRKRHPVTCSNYILFDTPWQAKTCGFYSETYWKKLGREIKDDQKPALVPLEIGVSFGLALKEQAVLGQKNKDWYYVVLNCDLYWSEAQTQEKPKKHRKRTKEEGGDTGIRQNTLCCRNKSRGRPPGSMTKPVNTGVHFSTPKSLIIPDAMKDYENEIRYMIHVVIEQMWNRKHDTGGGRIHSPTMRAIIGDPARELFARQWLCGQGILITDHTYSPGQRAKTYFLNPIYNEFSRYECKKKSLAAKVLLNRSRRGGKETEGEDAQIDRIVGHDKRPVDEHLDRWLSELSIDLDACESLSPSNPSLETAHAIANKDFGTSRCEYGRYHSPVTRLWTPYRQHLLWFGKRVVGLDVKNSQPVIVVKLMREHYWEMGQEFPVDFTEFARLVEGGTIYDDLFSDAKLQFPEYVVERKRRSLQKRQWTTEFHLYLANRVRPESNEEWAAAKRRFARARRVRDIPVYTGEVSRADFKVMVFADILFGRAEIDNPITRLFGSRFPSVAEWIRGQKAGSYKNLARVLQREESEIIIDTICEHLRVHHPEIPITPIHDSILTTEDCVPVVKGVIEKEYARRGLHPAIKVEVTDGDQAGPCCSGQRIYSAVSQVDGPVGLMEPSSSTAVCFG